MPILLNLRLQVVLIFLYGEFITGLLSPIRNAFYADCLPIGPDGRPRNPTRDTLIRGWSGILPGIVMPIIGGQLFSLFPSRGATYHFLFVWQLLLGIVSFAIFTSVPTTPPSRQQQKANKAVFRPPIGVRLCDRLCFKDSLSAHEALLVQSYEPTNSVGIPNRVRGSISIN